MKTRWEGIEREWTSALLNFTDMNGVDVSGEGTVDGSGDLWLQRSGFADADAERRRAGPRASRRSPPRDAAPRRRVPGLDGRA